MAEFPYVQFYPSDFLAGVAELTPAETGIYIVVLSLIYERGGPIPFDCRRLSRRMGINPGPAKKLVDSLIGQGKLSTTIDGSLTNSRAEMEIQKRLSASKKSAKGGSAKAEKSKQNQTRVENQAEPKQCLEGANQNHNQKQREESSSSAHDAPAHGNDPAIQIEEVSATDPAPVIPHSSPDPDAALRATVVAPASPAPPGEAEIMVALQAYNDAAHRNGLKAAIMPLDEIRRQRLADRIEAYGLSRWCEAMTAIDGNAFLRGEAVPGTKADLTFLLKPDVLPRILEGNFDERPKPPRKPRSNGSGDRRPPRGQHADADDGPATSIAQLLARDRRREQDEVGRGDGDQDHDRRDTELSGGSAGGGVVIDAVAGFTN